jgi:monoamine oxidase
MQSVVERILWEKGRVDVHTRDGSIHTARAAVITVPLPFLQDQSIAIVPEVPTLRKAARALVMGHVARVSVVVKERFWEKKVEDLAYVHTPERPFNVWWTMYPVRALVLTGWAGGPPAVELTQSGDVEETAVRELARAFGMRRERVESLVDSLVRHDWTADAHTRGAYAYVGVGGAGAARRLARAIQGTLFVAGEATDEENMGTVEAALASGIRAARQVVESRQ